MEMVDLNLVIIIMIFVAYSSLKTEIKDKSTEVFVRLTVETAQKDGSGEYPKSFVNLCKHCKFMATPVPGMELPISTIRPASIERVLIYEEGLEALCLVVLSPFDGEIEDISEMLKDDGWREG